MQDEKDGIIALFQEFMQQVLIEHQIDKVLDSIADDIIGIGMGTQGIVSTREDVIRIATNDKTSEGESPNISYENMQVRCFDHQYATVCGVMKISSKIDGKQIESSLGQLMNLRKVDGRWIIYTMQATPLFHEIEEMEAYPIKFAENVLEKYRQQEQIARIAQQNSIGIYRINFTKGCCEDSVIRNDLLIHAQRGDLYEEKLFESARRYLDDDDRYRFLSLFTIGNIFKEFNLGKTELSMEYQMRSPYKAIWLKTMVKLYIDKADQELKGYLYVIDIDKEKTKELELKNDAELDSLTGLYNRRYVESNINQLLKHTCDHEQGAFFMIDLDHFKSINDTYGHKKGDDILKRTAACMQSIIRKQDVAGRLGGDEFCIYFQGELTMDTVLQKAETLCQNIRKILKNKEIGSSCSIGIVLCKNPAFTFDVVYHQADQALYIQKKKGRDGYTFFSSDDVSNPS